MIYIVRHGQTDWNVLKKIQGKMDISLNNKGREQANIIKLELAKEPIDIIISSPLERARETAEIINKDRNLPIIYDSRIEERCFGIFEGKDLKYVATSDFWDYKKNEIYEGAESIQQFFERVYSFLDEIFEKYPDKNILLVSHGGVSIPVHCYFDDYIPEGSLIRKELLLDNCQVKKFIKKK